MHNFSKCGPAYVLLVLHTVEPTIISSLCGRLREVVAYKWWSFTGGGHLREVVTYQKWSPTRGQASGGVYISGNTHMMTGPFRHDDITVSPKSLQKVQFKVASYLHLSCCLIHPGL